MAALTSVLHPVGKWTAICDATGLWRRAPCTSKVVCLSFRPSTRYSAVNREVLNVWSPSHSSGGYAAGQKRGPCALAQREC
jgi:hypothetical protein